MSQSAETVQLKEETLLAFSAYIREAEAAMEQTLNGESPFLWSDARAGRVEQIREKKTLAELWSGQNPVKVPEGMIHDWIGATFAPGTTIQKTLALVQDYDHHENIYKPEVIGSKLIHREGDDFEIYLRLVKKKVITVVLDTWHDVHYASPGPARAYCRSYTKRICEVEDAGKPGETCLLPDKGYGFLWRLYSYWRFEERDGGAYVEVRAISLTRDVPKGLAWIIDPIVTKLPKQSLIATLESTRRALAPDGPTKA